MRLNLNDLKELHPRLPASVAEPYAHRAAVALQRQGHGPGCDLFLRCPDGGVARLDWNPAAPSDHEQLDERRATEDGAEAVALVAVKVLRQWTILRRTRYREHADWLLESGDRLVALEVSGIDGPPDRRRVKEKLNQVRRAGIGDIRAACVVAFGPPEAVLESPA